VRIVFIGFSLFLRAFRPGLLAGRAWALRACILDCLSWHGPMRASLQDESSAIAVPS